MLDAHPSVSIRNEVSDNRHSLGGLQGNSNVNGPLARNHGQRPGPGTSGRREPRAVKRRPKPFPKLNQPRHKFKEIAHAN